MSDHQGEHNQKTGYNQKTFGLEADDLVAAINNVLVLKTTHRLPLSRASDPSGKTVKIPTSKHANFATLNLHSTSSTVRDQWESHLCS